MAESETHQSHRCASTLLDVQWVVLARVHLERTENNKPHENAGKGPQQGSQDAWNCAYRGLVASKLVLTAQQRRSGSDALHNTSKHNGMQMRRNDTPVSQAADRGCVQHRVGEDSLVDVAPRWPAHPFKLMSRCVHGLRDEVLSNTDIATHSGDTVTQ